MLVLIVVVAGVLFSWWMASQADRWMRADLLRKARLVAQTVDIAHIKALSGTDADLNDFHYLRLKEQLSTVLSANPQCRFIYLACGRARSRV